MSGLPQCDPQRYGPLGVMRCSHGCVTECERARCRSLEDRLVEMQLYGRTGRQVTAIPLSSPRVASTTEGQTQEETSHGQHQV